MSRETLQAEAARDIVRRLREAGHEAFWVGGCVRDLLRGVTPGDYDIATSARPEEVGALFPRTIPIGAAFGVMLVVRDGRPYEVATYRRDEAYADGRRPSKVLFADARQDVERRDFTINGMLMDPISGAVIDYVGGRQDLEHCLIRTIGDPDRRFSEDYLRLLRACRFAASLNFSIDPETEAAIKRQASRIGRISAERIREELTGLLTRGGARRGFELLAATGLLHELLPEVEALRGVQQPARFHPEGDVWEHTLRMLALLPLDEGRRADACLAWAVLLHDIGKAVTRSEDDTGVHFYGHVRQSTHMSEAILRRLRFSRADADLILALVRDHMHFMHVRDMRPNRLKRFLRQPRFDLHLALHRLDCLGSHGLLDNHEYCLARLAELDKEQLHPSRLLSGRDLIAMGFEPGPLFGEILRAVEDAQLDGAVSTAADARRFVRQRFLP
ncbi:MAG: HD domain-containing protein [Deltaproteobacteria bacterium]|nr:HD domain-containing protein [Deltaproteobacteria bacterium]